MPPKLDRRVQQVMDSKYARERWPDEKERRSRAFAICHVSTGLSDDSHEGYLIDLDGMTFGEAGDPKWIQMFPYDTYYHPRYGEIAMTPEKAQEMADNVNSKVRGIDLDVDFEHKEGPDGGRAAGWILKAEAREDGLYGLVSWTKKALDEIKNKMWRYFSPEFADKWVDTKGNEHRNVLFGGALTNRPFLKNIAPINLSEHFEKLDEYLDANDPEYVEGKKEFDEPEGRQGLDPKELRKMLGLAEDASDDDVKAKIKQLSEPETPEAVVKLRESLGLDESADESKMLSEVTSLIEFRDEHVADEEKAKKFAEEFPEEAAELKRLSEERTAKKLEEWIDGSVKLDDGSRANRGIAPKLSEKVKTFRSTLKGSNVKAFDEIVEGIITTGLVEFSEKGSSEVPEMKTDQEEFMAEVNKFMDSKEGITFSEAVKAVSKTHPELARAYRQSTRTKNAS